MYLMEPQMNADERRYNLYNEFERTDTNSGRSELAFLPQYRTRMTRIGRIFTDIYYPCVSASSAQSVFYRSDSRTKSTGWKVPARICVPPRFFCNANFQYSDTLCRELAGFQHHEYRLVKLNLWGVEET